MADANKQGGLDVNPAPEGGRLFPYDTLVGVLPDADRVYDTVEALTARGFEEADITVLSGEEGVAAIDMKGTRHGLLGRIFKAIDMLGSEHDESQAHVNALRAGNLVLGVHIENGEEKDSAVQAFRQNDGRHVSYYSRWTTEHLIP